MLTAIENSWPILNPESGAKHAARFGQNSGDPVSSTRDLLSIVLDRWTSPAARRSSTAPISRFVEIVHHLSGAKELVGRRRPASRGALSNTKKGARIVTQDWACVQDTARVVTDAFLPDNPTWEHAGATRRRSVWPPDFAPLRVSPGVGVDRPVRRSCVRRNNASSLRTAGARGVANTAGRGRFQSDGSARAARLA